MRTRTTKTRRAESGTRARLARGGPRIEHEVARVVSGREARPRSYVARIRSADGKPMLGGVMESQSSTFSHREDAQNFLDASIEINADAGRPVTGEVVPSQRPPELRRHCPGAELGVLGGVCPRCRQTIR